MIVDTVTHNGKKLSLNNCSAVLSIITERECQVLKLICHELTSEEIAAELFISKNTVETHRKNLLAKLNCKSSIGLVKWAIEKKLFKL